jgi:MoaA/NifB/PqqE/SkfB family radical SAM enzyme
VQKIYTLIKLNRVVRNHRLKFATIWLAHSTNIRHLFLRFDPVLACNLSCAMCYFSNSEYRKNTKGIFRQEEVARIARLLFPKTVQLVIGCGTEPTLYKDFTGLVHLGKRYGIPYVGFTSNGQLLSAQHLEEFVRHGLDELALSVHGVRRETYERFMANASYETFHRVLGTLDRVKNATGAKKPYLRLNYTVNSENLDELGEFFEVFGMYTIKTLQIRPIMNIGGEYQQCLRPGDIDRYRKIVGVLADECRARGITLLANLSDPAYQSENYDGVILQAVRRYIDPDVVWRPDFRWREETYEEFCRRVRWGRHLISCVFSSRDEIVRLNAGYSGAYSAKYDVFS